MTLEPTKVIAASKQGLAVALALALAGSLLLALVGAAPRDAAVALLSGAFGSAASWGETLIRFAPVALIALGLIPSLRVGLFNIGGPGQLGAGALLGSLPGLLLPDVQPFAAVLLGMALAMLGGALPAAICGVLRAYLRVNEILSTLVFNMLIRLFLEYLLSGPMQGTHANLPQSEPLSVSSWLPTISSGNRAHWGLGLVALLLVGVTFLETTPLGFRLRLFGASPKLALQAGTSRSAVLVWTMAFAGACAGLAGWIQVAGVDPRLYATVADPVGYTGLFAVLLGGIDPTGVVVSSFFLAALLRGGDYMQIAAGISPELIGSLIGLMLLIIAGRSVLKRRRRHP